MSDPILVAITGASGSIYGWKLLELLAGPSFKIPVGLVVSRAGRLVMEHELGVPAAAGEDFLAGRLDRETLSRIRVYDPDDMGAPFSSGSRRFRALVVAPCTMNTVAAVASGITLNLVHRLADVALKEKRPLILVPRETPFSVTHLENLLSLARKGITVLPASPAFYHKPASLEDMSRFIVGKVLDQLGLDHQLYERWQGG